MSLMTHPDGRISTFCSEQRERNPLMLIRKHLIEQRGAASLKHSLDPKKYIQDPARSVGPADRAQRCSCWATREGELGQTSYWDESQCQSMSHGRGWCDSWSTSSFSPIALKKFQSDLPSTESQNDLGEKRSLSPTVNPELPSPSLNHVPKCHLGDLWKGRQGRNKVLSKKSVY